MTPKSAEIGNEDGGTFGILPMLDLPSQVVGIMMRRSVYAVTNSDRDSIYFLFLQSDVWEGLHNIHIPMGSN